MNSVERDVMLMLVEIVKQLTNGYVHPDSAADLNAAVERLNLDMAKKESEAK